MNNINNVMMLHTILISISKGVLVSSSHIHLCIMYVQLIIKYKSLKIMHISEMSVKYHTRRMCDNIYPISMCRYISFVDLDLLKPRYRNIVVIEII
jgi:hypothetical protein